MWRWQTAALEIRNARLGDVPREAERNGGVMAEIDLLLIAQSEVVRYEEYSQLPLDRIDLYRELVFPRMVYYRGAFRDISM